MKKNIIIGLTVISLLFVSTVLFAGGGREAAPAERTVHARLASEEVEGDFMTVWAEKFAEFMYEQTDGQFQLDVYPYGTLGDARDINELAQLGVVEYVFSDYAWISAFVPEAQVLALNYIWPRERMPEVLDWVVKNGDIMPFLEEAFRRNGLVPLSIMYEGWQWITSREPSETLDDLAGQRVRVMGSRLLVENYRSYGMSPTPMAFGEVYSALQTRLIDAQINPIFANYSMGFYEVTNYFTQMYAEPFLGIPSVNMQFFDNLPEEWQQLMYDFFQDNILAAADWIEERHANDRAAIEESRPDIVWTEFTDDEIARAREMAMTVWEGEYENIAGEGALEALELLLADIDNAKAALGM